MTKFWRTWLDMWCGAVGVFGLVVIGGAFAATDAPIAALLAAFGGPEVAGPMTRTLRFALGLMGAVSLGWAFTFHAFFDAAHRLGTAGAPAWCRVCWAVGIWFVVDSGLSIATGFALNAVSNAVLLVGFLVPVLASGVLGSRPARA